MSQSGQQQQQQQAADISELPFKGNFKNIINIAIQNITVGIIRDKYNGDLYWGTSDGYLNIFHFDIYSKNHKLIDNNNFIEGNLSQNGYCQEISSNIQIENKQNGNKVTSTDQTINPIQNKNHNKYQVEMNNSDYQYQDDYQYQRDNESRQSKYSEINLNNGRLEVNHKQLSNQNQIQFSQWKKNHDYCDYDKEQQEKIFNSNQQTAINSDLNETLDEKLNQQQQTDSNVANLEKSIQSDNQFQNEILKDQYPQIIDKLHNESIYSYSEGLQRQRKEGSLSSQIQQYNKNKQLQINKNQSKFKSNHSQIEDSNKISTIQNNIINNVIDSNQIESSQKNQTMQTIDTGFIQEVYQKVKLSDNQVFQIVVLKDFIGLTYFDNLLNIVNKQKYQIIYQLKGDIILNQEITLIYKGKQNEFIIRQDTPTGVSVWKLNNLSREKPTSTPLFSTGNHFKDLFYNMIVSKKSTLYYGNNSGTINAVNLKTGKYIKSFSRVFKNSIIDLAKNKDKQNKNRVLVGVDSKWNFKIFNLPYLDIISQFNVFNLGFSTPSFHQQLNIMKFITPDILIISGNSKEAVIYSWKQNKTLKRINYQNSNFNSFVNINKESTIILIKQFARQKPSFVLTEWS